MKFLKIDDFQDCKFVMLNRPDVKNAFHPEMIKEITETFLSLSQDKKLRAIFFGGEGSVFCAGADLNWMKTMIDFTLEENIQDSEKLWKMFEAILFCEVPVIGISQGSVFGGALGLLACCDYVFAEAETKFCFSEVKLGLAPAVISSFILKKLSDGFIRPFMLSGEIFTAEKAQQSGLVHAIYKGPYERAHLAKQFTANGLEAMRETKKLLNLISNQTWQQQKVSTTKVISERRTSAEGQERLRNFLNRG